MGRINPTTRTRLIACILAIALFICGCSGSETLTVIDKRVNVKDVNYAGMIVNETRFYITVKACQKDQPPSNSTCRTYEQEVNEASYLRAEIGKSF